jgi:betaine-aldehyde dehydrogenase
VHLELGGKAPVVVFDDADIEAAVEGIAVAGYFNAGQDCTAATRVLAGPASTTTSSPRSPSRPKAQTGCPDEGRAVRPVNNPTSSGVGSSPAPHAPGARAARPARRRVLLRPTVVADLPRTTR